MVAIILLGFVTSSSGIQQQGILAYQRSVAMQDANQVVEQMRDTAANGVFPANVTTVFNGTMATYTNLPSETITISYADVAADPLDARITVNYVNAARRNDTASLRTYITQRA